MTAERAARLRRRILELVADYQVEAFPEHEFIAGQTPIPVSAKVIDADELRHVSCGVSWARHRVVEDARVVFDHRRLSAVSTLLRGPRAATPCGRAARLARAVPRGSRSRVVRES